ncbi:hypothetical protein [Spirosoma horti]
MLTKLSLAAGLFKAFEEVMPEKFQQSDTTAYAAILDQENHLSFSPSAFYDDDHSLGPLPTAPVLRPTTPGLSAIFRPFS